MAYTVEFKKRVISYLEAGHSQRDASSRFGIGRATVYNWWKRHKRKDIPITHPPYRHKKIDPMKLNQYFRKHPEPTLDDVCKKFNCTKQAARDACKRFNYYYKRIPKKRGLKRRLKIDIEYIKMHPNVSSKELAAKFGCTQQTAYLVRKQQGLITNTRAKANDKLIQAYMEKHPNAGKKEIAESLGYSLRTTQRAVKRIQSKK